MKYASVRLVFDRKHLATKERTGLVQIEVLFQRKRKWISTGVKVYADQWSDKHHVVNRMTAIEDNLRLKAQVDAIEGFITELIKKGEPFSFERLDSFLSQVPKQENFIDFIEQRIDERGDLRLSTKRTHATLVSALRDFGGIRYISDLTKANITLFDDWLHSKDYSQTTVYGYHKRLKRYINEAIKFDLLQSNPYASLRIQRGKSEGIKYLVLEELQQLEAAPMPTEKLERARDLFIFQCYTGLSYSDLAKFRWQDVREEDGNYIIRDTRRKTDEEYFIVLLKPALRVLRKYDFELPVLSNQKYNDFLKLVAVASGINKPITTHWARHSYAVMMLSMGARMQNVARMLGHANTTITESTYAKVLARDLRKDYEAVNKKLK